MNSKAGRVVAAGVVVLVMLTMSVLMFMAFQAERVSVGVLGAPESTANRVNAEVVVREVDTARQELRFRLFLSPEGSLADESGRFAEETVVEVTDETGKSPITIKVGNDHQGSDLAVTFEEGEDIAYPLDRYLAPLELAARTAGDDGEPVPIRLSVFAANSNFRLTLEDDSDDAVAEYVPEVRITAQRSPVTKGLAAGMGVIMWALAIAVASVAAAIRSGRRRFEFATLTWMAAMLFAFVGFRNAAPGSPPFGSLFDFLAFFWVEVIVAVSLLVMVATYLRDRPEP